MNVRDIATKQHAQGLHEQPLMVLDVRTTAEFEAGHIPGALSMPFAELSAAVQVWCCCWLLC